MSLGGHSFCTEAGAGLLQRLLLLTFLPIANPLPCATPLFNSQADGSFVSQMSDLELFFCISRWPEQSDS